MRFSHYLFHTSLSLLLLLLLLVVVTVFGVWGFDLSTDRCVRTTTNRLDPPPQPPPTPLECHSTDVTEHFQQWKCGHTVTQLFLERGRWGLSCVWFHCAVSAVWEVQFSLENGHNCFSLDQWFHNNYTVWDIFLKKINRTFIFTLKTNFMPIHI